MIYEIAYTLTRGEEDIDLTIEYSMSAYFPAQTYGPPEHCSPAEGGEIDEMTILRDGWPFTLTEEEERAVEDFVYDHHDYDSDDYSEE